MNIILCLLLNFTLAFLNIQILFETTVSLSIKNELKQYAIISYQKGNSSCSSQSLCFLHINHFIYIISFSPHNLTES